MKEINILKEKIIKPADFFKLAAREFKKQNLKSIYFFRRHSQKNTFWLEYPAKEKNFYLSKEEISCLSLNKGKEVIYPQEELAGTTYLKHEAVVLESLKKKIQYYEIYALIPLYLEGKIISLIIFSGNKEKHNFYKKYKYIKKIKLEVQNILASILLYNQAIKRIIKNKTK
ncbi:MAG: hypothetical protein U5L76_02585 [Patescibacteria group bacterium]|nr:hypothetical protein [Patescibacteria group bacterium]